jgi:putative oxidoreductase
MDVFIKSGKYLLAIPMAIFGLFHFISGPAMAGMVPEVIPGGVLWVYLTGIAFDCSSGRYIT